MIDLKECIKICIENFDSETASNRILNYIQEDRKLIQSLVENNNFKNKDSFDDLKNDIRAIYETSRDICEDTISVLVI